MVQWLGFRAFTAGGLDLIPGQELRSCQATQCGEKKKKERYRKIMLMPKLDSHESLFACAEGQLVARVPCDQRDKWAVRREP